MKREKHPCSSPEGENALLIGGQRRMGRLIQADRRATLTEITTRYNRGMQSIYEATTRSTLRRMGYNSRRPHRVPLISTTNRKKRVQFARAH